MEKLSSPLKFFSELRQKFRRTRVENFLIPFEDFLVCEKFFKFCGLPLLGRVEIKRARKVVWACVLVVLLYALESLLSLVVHWGDSQKFIAVVENVAAIATSIFVFAMIFWFLYIRRQVKEVIVALDVNFPRFSYQQHNYGVRKYLKKLKVTSWVAGVVYFGVMTYILAFPFTHQTFCWMTSQSCEMLPILLHWFPFDIFNPLVYGTILIWYSCVGYIACGVLLLNDMLYVGLLTILSMEFDILAADMEEAQDESDLRKLIKVHQQLIEIAGKLEKIFAQLLLVYLFGVICMLCCTAFLSMMGLSPIIFSKYSIVFFAFFLKGFIICFYAQKLTDSSSSVTFAAFSTPWYERGLKFRKLLLIVMIIACEGQKLTAWSFFDVSMETFYWILDTAYSYYSVLMGLYDAGH